MLKKAYLVSAFVISINTCFAQTTFIPLGSEDYHVLDRLETRSGRLSDTIATGDRPESRRNAVSFLESAAASSGLSSIDQYNKEQMISENGE